MPILAMVLFSCSSSESLQWIRTDEDVALYLQNPDTTKNYIWQGESFEGVANGQGTVVFTDDDGKVNEQKTNAFYGAVNNEFVASLDDGSKFVGNIIDDMMTGYGVLVKDKELYIGEFLNSKPNGYLKMFKDNKLFYDGNWQDGAFNGEGTLYKEDGTIKSGTWEHGKLMQTLVDISLPNGHYKGTVLNGQPSGYGVMNYASGQKYSGKWKNGQWNGKGVFVSQEDSINGIWNGGKLNGYAYQRTKDYVYKGEYNNGLPDGIGTFTGVDSTTYSGLWSEGKIWGNGYLHFSNDDTYEGEWNNGYQAGIGRYTYASNGAYYEGEWENGLQHGYGIYHSPTFEYIGYWNEGWMTGKGKITFRNKDYYEGDFVENIKFGIGHYEFANGNAYDGEFVNDTFNGLGVFYFNNGCVYEGEFYNGKICGDGTLYLKTKDGVVAITTNWKGEKNMPSIASILFPNGDLYEGELVNGVPTVNGVWTTEKERKNGKTITNSLYRANEFYKRHNAKINDIVQKASIALTVVEIGGKVAGTLLLLTPLAPVGTVLIQASNIASVANNALLITHSTATISSSSIDVADAIENGGDVKSAVTHAGTQIATDVLLYAAPKIIKKIPATKILSRMSKFAQKAGGVAKTSSIILLGKNKLFARLFSVVRDKTGKVSRATAESTVANAVKKAVKKQIFKSAYLASKIAKTLIYKQLQKILAKEPIKLAEETFLQIERNPDMANSAMRLLIKKHTKNNDFLEFFIRLAMEDPQQVKRLLANKKVKEYINSRIRAGGVHEWLMTKNFEDFLTNPKWFKDGSKDGYFLALALNRLVQATNRVNFKFGSGHVASGRSNTHESVLFHKGLAQVISQCDTKEQLFLSVRKYAKEVLTKESYKEFNQIFIRVFAVQ